MRRVANARGEVIDKLTILRIKRERSAPAPLRRPLFNVRLTRFIDFRARQFDAHFIEPARPGYATTGARRETEVSGSAIVADKSYWSCD
jgi:hypothetical protein